MSNPKMLDDMARHHIINAVMHVGFVKLIFDQQPDGPRARTFAHARLNMINTALQEIAREIERGET